MGDARIQKHASKGTKGRRKRPRRSSTPLPPVQVRVTTSQIPPYIGYGLSSIHIVLPTGSNVYNDYFIDQLCGYFKPSTNRLAM